MRPLETLSPANAETVRTRVRALLERSHSWPALDRADRVRLAESIARVVAFVASARARPLALGPGRAPLLGRSGPGAGATGARAGALAQAVDFPGFVQGLLEDTFQAVVESSIQQMKAYAELVGAVAAGIEQSAPPAADADQAVEWLLAHYPGVFACRGGSRAVLRWPPLKR